MALRIIVEEGDEVLNKVCRPVEKFDARLARLLDDMAETVISADGMGLAAPQVGILRRLFVAVEDPPHQAEEAEEGQAGGAPRAKEDAPGREDVQAAPGVQDVLEFINPEITETEGSARAYEGCLSFPGRFGAVERPARVKVRAFTRDGAEFEYEGRGMMARCLCHEIDHLNGITFDSLVEYYYDPETPHDLDETVKERREDGEGAKE